MPTETGNLFLAEAQCDVCVLESGDTIPHEYAVEHMVRMFRDPGVGMVGAQKVAVDTPDHIAGLLSHLRLRMEHELCLEIPRLGEMIAFRKVFDAIPPDVAMDEAFVEALDEFRLYNLALDAESIAGEPSVRRGSSSSVPITSSRPSASRNMGSSPPLSVKVTGPPEASICPPGKGFDASPSSARSTATNISCAAAPPLAAACAGPTGARTSAPRCWG